MGVRNSSLSHVLQFAYFLSRQELAAVPSRLRGFQIAAGLVPLVGAILSLALGPEALEADSYLAFRWLTVGLIVLGMAGIPLSIHVGGLIGKSIDAFCGVDRAVDRMTASPWSNDRLIH